MENRAEWSSAGGERMELAGADEWRALAEATRAEVAREVGAEQATGAITVAETAGEKAIQESGRLGEMLGAAETTHEVERSAARVIGGRAMRLTEEDSEAQEGGRSDKWTQTDERKGGRRAGRANGSATANMRGKSYENGQRDRQGDGQERRVRRSEGAARGYDDGRGNGATKVGERNGERRRAPSTINTVQLREIDFADVYPKEKIEENLRYVQDRKERFQGTPQSSQAKAVERAFVRGVQMNRWLGNLSDETGKVAFSTRTHETAKYDDYLHRVDAFTVLRFREEIETDAGRRLRSVPLGFDVTTSGTKKTVWDKITHAYNDTAELPFGFSHLDYFTDGREKGELKLLPRYVIGVSAKESKEIENQLRLGMVTKASSEKLAVMRFKVLAEIRAQNELFQAMLPDDAYESEDEMVQLAQAHIEVADEQLNRALAICTNDLVKYRYLPDAVLKKIDQSQNSFKTRKIVEEYFLEKGRADAEKRRRTDAADWTDPFVQIMACTRELTQAAYDDSQPKRLRKVNARRRVMVHDRQLTLPEMETAR